MKRHALLLVAALCSLAPSFAQAGGGCSSQRRVSHPRPIYYPAPSPVRYQPAPVYSHQPVTKFVNPPRNVVPARKQTQPSKPAPLTTAQRIAAAKAALRIGHTDNALAIANGLLKQMPNDSNLLQFRSFVYFRKGELRRSYLDAYQAVKLGPIWDTTIVKDLYAYPSVYQRDVRTLREDQMIDLGTLFLSAYHHLVAGELEQGRDVLRRSLILQPKDKVASGLFQLLDQRLNQAPAQQLVQTTN